MTFDFIHSCISFNHCQSHTHTHTHTLFFSLLILSFLFLYVLQENEVPSCWVPIFDQGARGDPNLTVMPVATPYNNGPTIYQSPVVYSTEQFTNPPAIAGQVTQYPVSAYPAMGYATYPVNGGYFII
jgi:hypothetical protein